MEYELTYQRAVDELILRWKAPRRFAEAAVEEAARKGAARYNAVDIGLPVWVLCTDPGEGQGRSFWVGVREK